MLFILAQLNHVSNYVGVFIATVQSVLAFILVLAVREMT